MKKRLAVYCFYDKDGVVDDYVVFFLKALRKTVSKICCVANGKLTDSGRKTLIDCTDELTERENIGFDAWAYASFVNGRIDEIRQYDELVFCNNSFFGPIYPLKDVFRKMDGRPEKSDFWGMTVHPKMNFVIDKSQKLSYVNEHVQSYFVVFTKKVLLSPAFADFFRKLPKINTFLEAVCIYELELTRTLSDAGFTYGSFVDREGLPPTNCTVLYPDTLVRDKKCPFVKRKVFFAPYENFFAAGRGQNSRKCLEYIKNNTSYNVDLIWQHILRTQKMSVLRQNLNLNYILSSTTGGKLINPSKKAIVICYVYYPDDVEECLSYVRNAEGLADLFFVSSRDDTLETARKCLSDSSFSSVRFLKKTNKGRDLATYLIDCAALFDSYDYLCFVHDKKSPHLANHSVTHDFFRMCIESMLASKEYVINLLNAFETHPNFGLAVMPPLNFGPFYTSDYFENPGNHQHLLNLMKILDLNVPFDKNPVAPYGDMFWCRTAAMKKLFSKHWTYDDLPGEPIPPDGTILHALERIHPYVVQASGYYSAWVHPDYAAETYMNNIYHIDRTLNEKLFSAYGYQNLPQMVCNIKNSQIFAKKAESDAAKAAAERGAAEAEVHKAAAERAAAEALMRKVSAEKTKQRAIIDSWLETETNLAQSRTGLIDLLRFRYIRHSIRRQLRKEKKKFIEFFSCRKDIWDPEYYLARNQDVAEGGVDPLEHYVRKGWKENRNPSRNSVTADYLRVNPDCRLLKISPLEHYYITSSRRKVFLSFDDLREYSVNHGLEILKKSSRFNPDYCRECYRKMHGDVPEGFDPYSYYLKHGAAEAVKPSACFSVLRYYAKFPGIKAYGICPVVHYELIGKYL